MPQAILQSLERRDLNEEDYDLLLQLNSSNAENRNYSAIPEKVIKSWKFEKVRQNSPLLNPGVQCRICLRPYQLNQMVRKLPGCKHKFHLDCIDNWLLHSHPTCPIDGLIVWDPLTAQIDQEEKKAKVSNTPEIQKKIQPIPDLSLGIIINNKFNFQDTKNEPKAKLNDKFKFQSNQRTSSSDKDKKTVTKNNVLQIEIEGKNLNLHSNEPITHTRTILPQIHSRQKNSHFLSNTIRNRSNSISGMTHIGFHNNIFNNLFKMDELLNSKPYQLSRLPFKINNQSDFYDNDDQYDKESDELNESFTAVQLDGNYAVALNDHKSIKSTLSTKSVVSVECGNRPLNIEFDKNSQHFRQNNNTNDFNLKRKLRMKRFSKNDSNNIKNTQNFDFPLIQGKSLNQKF